MMTRQRTYFHQIFEIQVHIYLNDDFIWQNAVNSSMPQFHWKIVTNFGANSDDWSNIEKMGNKSTTPPIIPNRRVDTESVPGEPTDLM